MKSINYKMESQALKSIINQQAKNELEQSMDKWCTSYAENCSGGKMRGDRGADIEKFVIDTINNVGKLLGKNLVAIKGDNDKKELKIPGTEIKKEHQVDVHIYKDNMFVAVIECKAYLDSCYYIRACDDFKLFRKFGYDVKKYIFTLEDSIKEETKIFTDYETDNVCDGIFYMLDGKRSSAKPVYDAKFKKAINTVNLFAFIDFVCELAEN